MNKTTYCQYQKIVRKRAWNKYSEKHGIVDILLSLAVPILVALICWHFFKMGVDSVLVALATLGIFYFVYCILYLCYFAREHVIIYNEQKQRIDQFWPEELDVSVFSTNIHSIQNNKGTLTPAIVLEIKNRSKKYKIVELDGIIEGVSHTYIDTNPVTAITVPYHINRKVIWPNDDETICLRPEESSELYLSYLDYIPKSQVRLGNGGYTNWSWNKESVFQFDIKFMGKYEHEMEFKRVYYMNVFYSNPPNNNLLIGNDLQFIGDVYPKQFDEVINAARNGKWYDFSSPFQRQQQQKRKEERDIVTKKKNSKQRN